MSDAHKDMDLGKLVGDHLKDLGIETPMIENTFYSGSQAETQRCMEKALGMLGLDLSDDSLKKTPHRIAKMYHEEIFYGMNYSNFPRCMAIENKMKYDELICMKNVLVRSMCEHHFVPFIGGAHVAYLPGKKVIGLSKINRVVDFFSRRPQVQERLTAQIAHALSFVLETKDVAVVIDAEHYCIKLRGVQDPHSSTVTSKLLGKFKSVPELRNEFLQLTRK